MKLDKPHRKARFQQRQDQHALPARRMAALLVGGIFSLMFCVEYFQNREHWESIFVPRILGIVWALGGLLLMHGHQARQWGNRFHVSIGVVYPLIVVWFGYELDRIGVNYLSMTQGFAVIDLVLLATAPQLRVLALASVYNWLIAIDSLQLFKLKKGRHQAEHAMRELARSHNEMQHMADRDLLTGLFNRRAGLRHMTQLQQSAGPNNVMAMLEIDLDRFKPVNDQFGHKAGDVVLQITAERLMTLLHHGDVCCRFGGDEFIVALCRPQRQQIDQLIADLDYELSRPIALPSGSLVTVTASIGRCALHTGTDLEALIEQADKAMYLKKRQRSLDASKPF